MTSLIVNSVNKINADWKKCCVIGEFGLNIERGYLDNLVKLYFILIRFSAAFLRTYILFLPGLTSLASSALRIGCNQGRGCIYDKQE
jgi:hypothetical protein